MKKRYFWAIDLQAPASLCRFPSRQLRLNWIGGNPNRAEVEKGHFAFYAVRRLNRRMAVGEQISFPVRIEEG